MAIIVLSTLLYSRFQTTANSNGITVVGSFYPLAHFAEQVGGDRVTVINITPAGTEPHDFEPTPQDIATIQAAKLFLINGSGLDTWAEKIEPDLANKSVRILKMSNVVDLIENPTDDEHIDEHANEQVDEHTETATDPHFWLDPTLAQKQVAAIADALAEIDPANADYYQNNAEAYQQQLANLDEQYTSGLATCAKREVITSHTAFGYLAKRYNISVHAISGLSPEQEPSTKQLSELTELAREENINYILFETLVSPRLAETLANEIGAETLVFNPLEGLTEDELHAGATYVSVMENNLQTLRTALECQ